MVGVLRSESVSGETDLGIWQADRLDVLADPIDQRNQGGETRGIASGWLEIEDQTIEWATRTGDIAPGSAGRQELVALAPNGGPHARVGEIDGIRQGV